MRRIITAIIVMIAILSMNAAVLAQDNTSAGTKAPGFTDISGHWAEDSINRIVDQTMLGINDGKFQPNKPITRSEFVLLLHKSLGIQIQYFKATDIGEFYSDVKNEEPYASALYDLVIANIIDYKGTFRPNDTLTREEMVHFLMNAYKYKMGDKFKQIKLSTIPFADQDKINPVYSGEIARAEHDGLIKRPANAKFYPADLATRAQAVTVTDRLLRLMDQELSPVQVTPSAEMKDGVIHMKLTITNNSASKVVINHSSGQKFDFELLDAGRNSLYRWSADKSFIAALTQTVIEPGKSLEFSDDVNLEQYSGVKVKAAYLKAYIIGTSENLNINTDGYETIIK
jgi:hypothetical protein